MKIELYNLPLPIAITFTLSGYIFFEYSSFLMSFSYYYTFFIGGKTYQMAVDSDWFSVQKFAPKISIVRYFSAVIKRSKKA
jgi:hypothetical protein